VNDTEIQRIAAGVAQFRPDWPAKQLETLLRDKRMVDRPRRDVMVALSWIAAERETKNPYRVVEMGPWWQAAAIMSTASERRTISQDRQCIECGHAEDVCRRLADGTHEFSPVSRGRRAGVKADPELMTQARADIAAVDGPQMAPPPDPDERCGRDGCVRGATHTGPCDPAGDNDDHESEVAA